MTKYNLLFSMLTAGLTIICAACGTDTPPMSQAPPGTESATSAAPIALETAPPNPPVDARADSTTTLNVPAGDSVVVLLGKLKSQNQKMTVRVPVQNKRRLTATLLASDANSNVRFTQFAYPDGKSEGPFGTTISVATPQNGEYQLLIGHNQMAEGSTVEEFELRLVLNQ